MITPPIVDPNAPPIVIVPDVITEALISENKMNYISLQRQKLKLDKVYTMFDVVHGVVQPTLNLYINRVLRAQRVLTLFPEVVIMNANGSRIIIDCISKVISFGAEDHLCGVIQYEYDSELNYNILSIFHNCIGQNNVIQCPNQADWEFKSLRVFSVILERGGIISINDGVEKILHIPLLDPQFGYIGETPDLNIYFARLNLIRRTWPELNIVLIVKNRTIKVYSDVLKYEYNNENPGIIKAHKNHGSDDVVLAMTHICQKM